MRSVYLWALAFLLIGAGCAPGVPLTSPPTLDNVKERLAGQSADPIIAGHRPSIMGARSVVVGVDTTTYVERRSGLQLAVPTAEIKRIVARPVGRVRTGAVLGALPGLTIVGVGIYEDQRQSPSGLKGLPTLAGLAIGVPAALIGGGIGALIGRATVREREVYRAPVERYLHARPPG